MKQYQEAGVSRLVTLAAAAAAGDGINAVRDLAPVVDRAAKL
jgi:hypothetical protein